MSLVSTDSRTASDIAAARQADIVAFLHRAPFTLDAYKLGFLPGFREDCGYQENQYQNLTLPVGMLDNDFRNPDLDRFVDRFFEHEPQVGVIGDIYERGDVDDHVAAAREIQASYPEAELIIVPKSQAVIDAIPKDLVLGYSRGYADRLAHEFSDPADWRGRRVHILGGSPPKQLEAIRQLTRPTLTDEPPADIVGVDWNGLHRGAQFGEFWTADGWDDSGRDASHVTVRKTVRHSLARIKAFWHSHGVWPDSTLHNDTLEIEYEGPSPTDLESAACTDCGANVWTTRRGPFVAEYDTGALCGYCSYDCYFAHRHRNTLEEIAGEQSVYLPPA
ncbi:hypothetical protein PN419_14695 [Halorubrum ezzemoulense]|jgi:hypothetical protein|uniref:DUF6610 family protein n=1 Tax=Halobacteriales TaxID=2235 RepID=UPI0019656883|nr:MULTISPECIES: DUF6610 family protein [Halobacteria]MDB9234631.1 hypothetical protein [Halorubrum ezzemoulense]MDB9250233.1 hypothetical protein [Halorubrum ezzemoulense]MDB9260389.1 hypothetical protein [Halorubrum ezzemoulense]MDB9263684.1 hypothetical protein [Halorubrum ezzemoulense]MDB9267299.1 hypothetical protein [Halorubrum ezzemoulense]